MIFWEFQPEKWAEKRKLFLHCKRPGTENTPSIAGLGKACELAKKELAQRIERLKNLRDMLCGLLAVASMG